MKTEVYNQKSEVVGSIDLPERVFGERWRPVLVQQMLLSQLANRRKPWAHAKGRGEVSGGGRKPWRQKGTGRARHGSIRSPLWSGGGKAHGPVKERDYSEKITKKMRQVALFSLLSKKFADKEIKFFDTLTVEMPKTKMLAATLRPLLNVPKHKKNLDVLLVPRAEELSKLSRAARNIPKTKVASPMSLNVYDLLNYTHIFIDQDTVAIIGGHYKK
ncbi:MAG: 50S ribosomal protein L4 [Patescibacteria group bacterium]